jgi:hypothetical protein
MNCVELLYIVHCRFRVVNSAESGLSKIDFQPNSAAKIADIHCAQFLFTATKKLLDQLILCKQQAYHVQTD